MKKRMKIKVLLLLVSLLMMNFINVYTVNPAYASSNLSVTNPDTNPDIIYLRVGQTKNVYDHTREFSYKDISGQNMDYNDHDSVSSALRSATQKLTINDRNYEFDGFHSISISQNGDITGLRSGTYDPRIFFQFNENSGIEINVILQDSKPDIYEERFDILL